MGHNCNGFRERPCFFAKKEHVFFLGALLGKMAQGTFCHPRFPCWLWLQTIDPQKRFRKSCSEGFCEQTQQDTTGITMDHWGFNAVSNMIILLWSNWHKLIGSSDFNIFQLVAASRRWLKRSGGRLDTAGDSMAAGRGSIPKLYWNEKKPAEGTWGVSKS